MQIRTLIGLWGLLLVSGCNSCHEEPTIVIRFEPSDADVRPSASPVARPVATPSSALPAAPAKKAAAQCRTAADCVVMPADCCDCANGGQQHAVPKAKAAALKAERQARCKHAMCTMMLSTDPSCGMVADCVAAQCVMAPRKK